MKLAKMLRLLWVACLVSVGVMGGLSWWLLQAPHAVALSHQTSGTVSWLLVAMAVAEVSVAILLFRFKWQPLCDQSLKLVWAGRLVNGDQGKATIKQLLTIGLLIMVCVESLAVYAVVLALLGIDEPALILACVVAAAAGLSAFYWQGILGAADLFRHVERLTRS